MRAPEASRHYLGLRRKCRALGLSRGEENCSENSYRRRDDDTFAGLHCNAAQARVNYSVGSEDDELARDVAEAAGRGAPEEARFVEAVDILERGGHVLGVEAAVRERLVKMPRLGREAGGHARDDADGGVVAGADERRDHDELAFLQRRGVRAEPSDAAYAEGAWDDGVGELEHAVVGFEDVRHVGVH